MVEKGKMGICDHGRWFEPSDVCNLENCNENLHLDHCNLCFHNIDHGPVEITKRTTLGTSKERTSTAKSYAGWSKLPPPVKIATIACVLGAIGALGPWSVRVIGVQAWGYTGIWGWVAAGPLVLAAINNLTREKQFAHERSGFLLPGISFAILTYQLIRIFINDAQIALGWGLPLGVAASGVAFFVSLWASESANKPSLIADRHESGTVGPPRNNPSSAEDIPKKIEHLSDLHKSGALTSEEFESKKKELLERL